MRLGFGICPSLNPADKAICVICILSCDLLTPIRLYNLAWQKLWRHAAVVEYYVLVELFTKFLFWLCDVSVRSGGYA